VHAHVRLPVAGEMLGQHWHGSSDGLFENTGVDGAALPANLLWQGGIDGA